MAARVAQAKQIRKKWKLHTSMRSSRTLTRRRYPRFKLVVMWGIEANIPWRKRAGSGTAPALGTGIGAGPAGVAPPCWLRPRGRRRAKWYSRSQWPSWPNFEEGSLMTAFSRPDTKV